MVLHFLCMKVVYFVKHGQEKNQDDSWALTSRKYLFKFVCSWIYSWFSQSLRATGSFWNQKMLWIPEKLYSSPRHSRPKALPALFETSPGKNALCFPQVILFTEKRDKVNIATPIISDEWSVYFAHVCYHLPSEANCFLNRNWKKIDKENRFGVRWAQPGILTLWSRGSQLVLLSLSYLFNKMEIIISVS